MESNRSVYLAGPLGFSEPGRQYHERVVLPTIASAGLVALDPWPDAADVFAAITIDVPGGLHRANTGVGTRNEEMLRECAAVLAVLDGSDVDSGTAAEVGFAAALGKPIVGLRTDIRMSGDNEGTAINLQVAHFIRASGGLIETTCDAAVATLCRILALPIADTRGQLH